VLEGVQWKVRNNLKSDQKEQWGVVTNMEWDKEIVRGVGKEVTVKKVITLEWRPNSAV